MLILTNIWSLAALTLGALCAGATAVWWVLHKKRRQYADGDAAEKEMLYLTFSRIGHRLKTAGEIVRGHLYGFNDELPKDAERWRVARKAIADEASGISTLVERLDLVVRLGMTRQPLVIEPVNVARMLEDLMVDLGPAADARGIFLGGVVAGSTRDAAYVSGDASVLREVFSNLLENAVRHNEPGTEVKAEVRQQDGDLLVRIADTGKGIRPEVLSGLFDGVGPSYRPQMTKGSGMGLYLCKLLVELHGGQITASTEAGKGTEFRILLPLRRTR